MLLSSIVTLCLASSIFAIPTEKRAESLSVELFGPSSSVTSIDELRFTAIVKNTGSEVVKILKYGTILDDALPTRSFAVSKNGVRVPFTGVMLSVSMADLDETSFAVIPAGESLTFQHEVASLFDFESAGTGTFTFEPIVSFRLLTAEDTVTGTRSFSQVLASTSNIEVEVTHDIAKRALYEDKRRAVNICPDPTRRTFIDASYTEGKALASAAVTYVNSRGANDTLYQAYWGVIPTSRVVSVLSSVASEAASRTLSCVDSFNVCTAGVIAYTVTATTNIYYCNIFFNELPTVSLCNGGTTVAARNVRGGTTLHELTHALVGTDDVVYGCAADQALPDPQASINADNFNCFTTQVYANTMC